MTPRIPVRRILACTLLAAATLGSPGKLGSQARQTWPPVVYVVDFGNSDLNTLAVSVIRTCCREQAKAVAANPAVAGCPAGLSTCEFLRLQETGDKYLIQNEYSPRDPSHDTAVMMVKAAPYGARDAQGRRQELMKALRSLITCHDAVHGGTPDSNNLEAYCRKCGPSVRPPELPTRPR
jgi:hypothetical protein